MGESVGASMWGVHLWGVHMKNRRNWGFMDRSFDGVAQFVHSLHDNPLMYRECDTFDQTSRCSR